MYEILKTSLVIAMHICQLYEHKTIISLLRALICTKRTYVDLALAT